MKNSIIIINKDDEGIKDTLDSLAKLNLTDTEIIVVDASSHKLDWIKKGRKNLVWIDFTPNPSKITIPEQRNVGIKHAKGDIIIFLDASCVPDNPDWLTKLTQPILKDKEVLVRGSLSNIKNHVTVTEKIGDKVYVTESPTINMAINREVFDQIGIFDETFLYGSDMDFSWRATHAGLKIRYIEDAPLSHNFGDTKQNVKRYIQYGKARTKLYLNHPYYLSRIKNYELKSLTYFFIICLSPLVFIFPLYAVILVGLFIIQIPGGDPLKETTERLAFSYGMIKGLVTEMTKPRS